MSKPEISVVIPLYNEEEVFKKLKARLLELKKTISQTVEFVLVDDGSKDNGWRPARSTRTTACIL